MPINATPLISVIVPVYNAEDYLRYCVDSILQQSYTNLEVILVDDGAKDSSPAICDEYATQDSRVTVIHQENGGIAKAQNTGLDAAHGEYIAFSDNDDILDTWMDAIDDNLISGPQPMVIDPNQLRRI